MKVILLMAVTADGMIAKDSLQLVDWTGKVDKQYFVQVTREAGAMVMGSKTFDTIGRVLPGRKNIVMTRNKKRKSRESNLVFTDQKPEQVIRELESEGYSSVTLIGGAEINSLFIKAGLVNEAHLTVVPIFFGQGLTLFNRTLDLDLELIGMSDIGSGHVVLRYRVDNKTP